MCKLVKLDSGVCVADIKKNYIKNIIEQAKKCSIIDKVILFGSSIEERCTEDSDIDIAVFGNKKEYIAHKSKAYNNFQVNLFRFDDSGQNYDILYLENEKKYQGNIASIIDSGVIIYKKGL